MKNFILDNKDFDSMQVDIPEESVTLELKRLDEKYFAVLEYYGEKRDLINEAGVYTKKELETLWKILSEK